MMSYYYYSRLQALVLVLCCLCLCFGLSLGSEGSRGELWGKKTFGVLVQAIGNPAGAVYGLFDPVEGVVSTVLFETDNFTQPMFDSSAFNPFRSKFTFVALDLASQTRLLITLDSNSGKLIHNVTLSNTESIPYGLQYLPSFPSDLLVGILGNSFVSIDPSTGEIKTYLSFGDSLTYVRGSSTADTDRNYYFASFHNDSAYNILIAIDVKNSKIYSQTTVTGLSPIPNNAVTGLAWYNSKGVLIGQALGSDGNYTVVSVDSNTGAVSYFNDLNSKKSFFDYVSYLDANEDIYYSYYFDDNAFEFYLFDLNTNEIQVSKPSLLSITSLQLLSPQLSNH